MAKVYDAIILGGTAAGYAAACHLAKSDKSLSIAVVSPPAKATECPLADWVPRGFYDQPFLTKTFWKDCSAEAFQEVTYHSQDGDNQTGHRFRKAAGHFIPAGCLVEALHRRAKTLDVTVRNTTTEPAIQLQEDSVTLMGSTQVRAQFLIVAQDRPSEVIGELALPARTVPRSSLVVSGLDVPLDDSGKVDDSMRGTFHVAEMPERSELGMAFLVGNRVHLRMISSSLASGNRATELSSMLSRLQHEESLPGGLQLGKARGAVWHPPASVALEVESHVAKRCILAGTAGGFVESITGHTGLPTVWSAVLAADTVLEALGNDDPQETLMGFKTLWRREMADYLRPPNTSLHMLLPLLFANKRIVSRFTSALLFGENI